MSTRLLDATRQLAQAQLAFKQNPTPRIAAAMKQLAGVIRYERRISTKTEVKLLRERIEVPCIRHSKISYRWTNGYYVVDHAGSKIYPPVRRSEAYSLARELFGENIRVVID